MSRKILVTGADGFIGSHLIIHSTRGDGLIASKNQKEKT